MFGNFYNRIFTPTKWKMAEIFILGTACGLALFIFFISRAWSYLGDDPKTCVNCHIMSPQYETWFHSSHRIHTTCNDCHVPHNNVFNKYYFKAKDGMRHATIFTLRTEPQVIFIHEAGQQVVQNNCIRCHANLITDSKLLKKTEKYHESRTGRQCWECHRVTPHGTVNGISATPHLRIISESKPVPDWLIAKQNP